MRWLEAISRTVKEEVARSRARLEKAEEIMQKDLFNLYVSTDGLAHVGAKIPLGRRDLVRLLKRVRKLITLKDYLTPEEWLKRYEKFKIELSGLQFVSDRAPRTPQLVPKVPFDGGDGPARPRETGKFSFITRRLKRERTTPKPKRKQQK